MRTRWGHFSRRAALVEGIHTFMALALCFCFWFQSTVAMSSSASSGSSQSTVPVNSETSSTSLPGEAPPAKAVRLIVVPNNGQQGQQNLSVAIEAWNAKAPAPTHWLQGTTAVSFGAGITVASMTVNSPNSATAVLNIDPAAAIGPRTVIVTTGTEIETLVNGFTVTSGTPVLLLVNPNSGQQGQQTLSVAIMPATSGHTHWLEGKTSVSFGGGITVASLTVNSPSSATAVVNIDPAAATGPRTVIVTTGSEIETLVNGFTVTTARTGSGPLITSFSPNSASIGTVINVTGNNFVGLGGVGPRVTLNQQSGGTIAAPVASFTAAAFSFVVPAGAASGPITVTVGSLGTTSTASLSIVAPSSFTLAVSPGTASVIQGQSTVYAVTLSSTNGFNQLANLSVSGVPGGITATLAPTQITAGQSSVLTLTAPAGQTLGSSTLTVSASATVAGQPVSQSAKATLQVTAVTTSLLGRTVVDDALRTPIGGVTIKFLGVDGAGNTTGCSAQTVSDAGGNFSLTNLPSNCTGPQLISYDGSTATSPPGQFAGVNLSYTLTASAATVSPVLIHLPQIDNAETVQVQQNAPTDQTFTFRTIPGLIVTVYAGTTFTLADNSKPDPFPLIAREVPVDRLPDVMPPSSMLMPFIVAFQPANAMSSQPVAVDFPNTLNTPPGVSTTLMTLDPTRGFMVPYGTGTVSADGTRIIADADPAHPGHAYGLIHFDWHGPSVPPQPPSPPPPCDTCPCPPTPVTGPRGVIDLSSGINVITATDITINGHRGSVSIIRNFRTLSVNAGPFGIGSNHNYGYQLDTFAFLRGAGVINLIMPEGGAFPFNAQPGGSFINTTVPSLRGAVLTAPSSGVYSLRWKDGRVYQFQAPAAGPRIAYLASITDIQGNVVKLTLNPSVPGQVTQVTDPVGRSLTLSYDSSDRITSITDPIGRSVQYSYNSQGTLATVTDPAGGITTYSYDAQNNLLTVKDARGVVTEQNTYDSNGRAIQQVQPDGGTYKFAYTLLNPAVPASPVMLTVVTDPLGNQTSYRFTPNQQITDVSDPTGQTKTFTLDPGHNNQIIAISGAAACYSCGDSSQGNQTFMLDDNGNILTRTDALGNTTTFTYDLRFNKIASVTDPLGDATKFSYDSTGSVLTQTDPNGNTTSFTYNSFGQVTQTKDPLGNITSFSYDAFGNLTSTTDPLGNTTSTVYDAISRPTQTVDALGRKSQTTYDALSRMVSQTDAQGNSTQFAYDGASNVLSVTDAKGNKTGFAYDGMNRLLTKTDPLGHTDTRTYDQNGNLVKFVDRRGQTSTFSYDSLNQMTTETYQDSTVMRSYDANGRLTNATDSTGGSFDFTYDAAGHLLSSASPIGTVQFVYDAADRVASRTVVGQSPVAYSYDPAGNLLSASMPSASANFTYDADGRLTTIARGNGAKSQYAYDPADHLLSIIHSGGIGTSIPISYTYDPVGNRTVQSTTAAQALITQAAAASYDAGNRLLHLANTAYTFDANGNETSATSSTGSATYTWDARNRLQSIATSAGQTTIFVYDFAGNLLQQSDSGTSLNLTKQFVLDDLTNIAYISRSDGDQQSILAGRSIDQHLAVIHLSGQVEYGLTDAINSITATVDQSGKTLASLFYEPFGQTTTTCACPFQYTGRVPATGSLYYYRARYYDSTTSRFVSEDPAELADGKNKFAYVANSPVNLADPAGLFASITPALAGAVGFCPIGPTPAPPPIPRPTPIPTPTPIPKPPPSFRCRLLDPATCFWDCTDGTTHVFVHTYKDRRGKCVYPVKVGS